MSSNGTHLYRFGEFSFDAGQNVLLRAGKPLAMTPKTLRLLEVLIENHGRLVEKESLMNAVWSDSFVEEGNLKFTANQLRKALGDSAQKPLYIETVQRRGYRFIAKIEESYAEEKNGNAFPQTPAASENNSNTTNSEPSIELAVSKNRRVFTISLLVLCISLIGFTSRYLSLNYSDKAGNAPIFSAPRRSEPLSYSGDVSVARISPDGKYAAYINISQGKQTIWLRDMTTGFNSALLPFSDDEYLNLMFSGKSDFVYFVRKPKAALQEQTAVFRISIFGGIPIKLLADTQGWFSVSPADDRIAFARNEAQGQSVLTIADADGKNQRKLAVRDKPYNFRVNRWSPDGLTIAVAVGQSENLSNEFGLHTINVETGEEKPITPRKFFSVSDLEWLPDGSSLLFTARENTTPNNQIWSVSLVDGEPVKQLDEAVNYKNISLDKAATQIIATEVSSEFHLSIAELSDPNNSLSKISSAPDVARFTPGGKIVYSSRANGRTDVWTVNADGTAQTQLTNNSFDDFYSMVSPDERYVFFTSNRSGEAQVWRMNADGSEPVQITHNEGGFPISLSPDGKQLFYLSAINRNIWRVSADGAGGENLFFGERVLYPAFSADGKFLAYFRRDQERGNDLAIHIISAETKQTLHSFDQVLATATPVQINWAADGKSLFYTSIANSLTTLWQQPFDQIKPQKIADLEGDSGVVDFSLSPDNTKFAVVRGGWRHNTILLKGFK